MVCNPCRWIPARKRDIASQWRVAYALGIASAHSMSHRLLGAGVGLGVIRECYIVSCAEAPVGDTVLRGEVRVLQSPPLVVGEGRGGRITLLPIPVCGDGIRLDTAKRWPEVSPEGVDFIEHWLEALSDPEVWDKIEDEAITGWIARFNSGRVHGQAE